MAVTTPPPLSNQAQAAQILKELENVINAAIANLQAKIEELTKSSSADTSIGNSNKKPPINTGQDQDHGGGGLDGLFDILGQANIDVIHRALLNRGKRGAEQQSALASLLASINLLTAQLKDFQAKVELGVEINIGSLNSVKVSVVVTVSDLDTVTEQLDPSDVEVANNTLSSLREVQNVVSDTIVNIPSMHFRHIYNVSLVALNNDPCLF